MSEPFQFSAMEVLQLAPMGILVADSDQRILWVNDMLVELVGTPAHQLLGRSIGALNVEWLDGGAPEGTLALRRSAENLRDLHYRRREVSLPGGRRLRVYAFMDISPWLGELAQLKEAMAALVVRDEATGLLNQRGAAAELESQVARSRRYHNPLSVVRLDIIDWGGAGREPLLRSLAEVFNNQLRWTDRVCRWDEDAFLFILPETARDSAVLLARKLVEALAHLNLKPEDRAYPVAAQCAVTEWSTGDDGRCLLTRLSELLEQGGAAGKLVVTG